MGARTLHGAYFASLNLMQIARCNIPTPEYNLCMTKQTSLEKKIDALTSIVEKGFGAVADDTWPPKRASSLFGVGDLTGAS
jgi:hypothetical protein